MIFQTQEEWEVKDPNIQLLGGKGIRRYPFIRVSLNVMIFHVDFIYEGEDFWNRYIFFSIFDVLSILEQDDIKKINVSLQSRRCDNEDREYGLSTIQEIVKAKNNNSQTVYVYRCKNGKTYLESDYSDNVEELKGKKVIYFNRDI